MITTGLAKAATIKVGTWSLMLLLASVHGLIVAVLLARAPRNRTANRCLALLLVAVVLLLTPYTIGYAGFYDAYPWLSFAPLRWTLAFGPLMYGYVRHLGAAHAVPGWWRHYVPAFVQGAYYTVVFLLPAQAKSDWDDAVHTPIVQTIENLALDVSLVAYWIAAWRHMRTYQRWLVDNSAAREDFHLNWLRGFLGAMALVVVALIAHQTIDAVLWLSYFDDFPLYLALSMVVYYLGIEGWRHAGAAYPPMRDAAPSDVTPTEETPAAGKPATTHDWAALGRRWAERVAAEGWWRESDLDLADLARRLGTNTQYLSRALNEGLGERYSDFINRQRVEEAQRLLAGTGDVLAIANAVGFASKASFNRAFRAHAGCTPSEYRQKSEAARLNA
jgi:AraC-like DNA-binding protein